MKPIVRNFLMVAGIAGALAGWMDSSRTLKVVEKSADAWSPAAPRIAPNSEDLAQTLLDTGHFVGPAKPEPVASADAGNLAAQEPELPEVIATANLDGEIAVSLRSTNGAIRTVKVGDEIEGAWKVESATLTKVVLSRSGETAVLPVYPEAKADG